MVVISYLLNNYVLFRIPKYILSSKKHDFAYRNNTVYTPKYLFRIPKSWLVFKMKVHTRTNKENTRIMLEFESEFSSDYEFFVAHVWMSPSLCKKVIRKLQYELKKVDKQLAKNHK